MNGLGNKQCVETHGVLAVMVVRPSRVALFVGWPHVDRLAEVTSSLSRFGPAHVGSMNDIRIHLVNGHRRDADIV